MIMNKDYETIDTVKQRNLLEITRLIGRFLTDEEFNAVIMFYKNVLDRVNNENELEF